MKYTCMGNTHTASLDASYTIHMGNVWNSVNKTLCWGSNCTPAWDTEAASFPCLWPARQF